MTERKYDLIVFGASSFVGQLTAAYLAGNAPADLKVALAGRSREKVEKVREGLSGAAAGWPVIIADSGDRPSLDEMAKAASAIITTVGPYAKYGLPLVEACAEAGTDYADLTGETVFMRRSIDVADEVAKKSGARIVHTCGFDSIPSDLGVLAISDAAEKAGAGGLLETTLVVKGISGGVSGGTIDSMRGQIVEARSNQESRRIAADPYSLSPDRAAEPDARSESDPKSVSRDPDTGEFLAPFIMGMVNSRVVRRSNALTGWSYGKGLRYRELMSGGGGPVGAAKAAGVLAGLAGLAGGLSFGPTRAVFDRFLPSPGEGPDEEKRDKGFFNIEIKATTESGRKFRCKVKASGDPGYKATAVMLGEAGLCLALDGEKTPETSGVLTPATAMGEVLTDRLRAAGHTYEVSEV